MTTPIRLLTYSTLYPNAAQPNHGVFVENRLRNLLATGEATARVLAPVPWFPSAAPVFGTWSRYAAVPRQETRHGIPVAHPRYPAIPRVGMSMAPFLLATGSMATARRMLAETPVDLIDAHYVYPDGIAAVRLARALGLPVVITARGSDITQLPDYALPRRMIERAVRQADALIAVSAPLGRRLVELGASEDRVTVLRNGVDTALFRPPADRAAARAALGIAPDARVAISVGGLVERKGHHRTIAAMATLPDVTLLIAGEGPERANLAAQIAGLGLQGRVRLLGARPHGELAACYGAADVSVLASSREGWANVLLESMACGTPAVASDIPGNPDVVQERAAGMIVPNTAEGIAAGIRDLLAAPPPRAATRAYAERFGWEETSRGQLSVFRAVLARRGAIPAAGGASGSAG